MDQGPPLPPIAKDDIFGQLEHMLASPDFHATPHQKALLKYIMKGILDDNAHETTEDTLAVEVFARGPDYDRRIDPIVGIQADILRRALTRYYQDAGKDDPIRIDIPSGTYVPVIKTRNLNRS